ncbi:MAG: DUF3786 domain-containing protein [Deltaproteobacteria bacterium]|nr:DUF3786 domain-containing protein [Deltaproteobacteria bacterium]
MSQLNNPVEILKVLNKSNCKECDELTCLAFAAAVFKGNKQLAECPHLESDVIERFRGKAQTRKTPEQDLEESVEQLKRKVASINLSSAAERLGARFSDGKLTISICGKNFDVDSNGNLFSEIHMHPWVTIPILSYILNCKGVPVSGKWVPLRELEGGKDWYRLFGQRCEKPLKKVADSYTDLFNDMLHIFNGKHVENHYQSDISLVLHPLPLVPILICYWKAEDGLESSLNMFFDSTAEDNLNIESIYALGTGLVRMFEKIALTHGS